MTDEASSKAPLETGGVLMGYWGEGLGDPVITDAVGPGPCAVHTLESFVPDQEYHEIRIAELYQASNRRIRYLGDWHTHPGADAYLSKSDQSTLLRIALAEDARAPHPLMLILAPGPIWSPHVWLGEVLKSLMRRTARLRARRIDVQIFRPGDD